MNLQSAQFKAGPLLSVKDRSATLPRPRSNASRPISLSLFNLSSLTIFYKVVSFGVSGEDITERDDMLLEVERPADMAVERERKYSLVEIARQLIANMKLLGWSKYRLAKELEHTWGTVHAWERGWWNPEPQHLNELQTLFIAECGKRGWTTFEFNERYGVTQK